MRLIPVLFLSLGFVLAGCGADGPPVTPVAKTDGIVISGEASVGVTVTN